MNYDIIIDQQIGWGASSANYVLERLRELKGRPVRVYVSSFGGAVADAFRIQQAFREHGDVTCYLVSFVASAATLLTLGAKRIVLDPSCLYLAHKCSYYIVEYGQMNEDELREAIARLAKNADDLVTIDKVAANLYAARSGKTYDFYGTANLCPSDYWYDNGAYMCEYLAGAADRETLAKNLEAYWTAKN